MLTGSVFYDVASCHRKESCLALEDLFKSCKVGRVGDIYRNIVGENINIFFIRNGHTRVSCAAEVVG